MIRVGVPKGGIKRSASRLFYASLGSFTGSRIGVRDYLARMDYNVIWPDTTSTLDGINRSRATLSKKMNSELQGKL